MTVIALDKFQGEIPRLPPHLLPEGAAQRAINCEFSYGELRSLRGYGEVKPACEPPATVFATGEGKMLSWPTPTRAYLSPTIDDTHGRVYFNNADGLFVTTKDQAFAPDEAVCAPPLAYRVGLPVPGIGVEGGDIAIEGRKFDVVAEPELIAELDGAIIESVPLLEIEIVTENEEWVLRYDPAYIRPQALLPSQDYDGSGRILARTIEGRLAATIHPQGNEHTVNMGGGLQPLGHLIVAPEPIPLGTVVGYKAYDHTAHDSRGPYWSGYQPSWGSPRTAPFNIGYATYCNTPSHTTIWDTALPVVDEGATFTVRGSRVQGVDLPSAYNPHLKKDEARIVTNSGRRISGADVVNGVYSPLCNISVRITGTVDGEPFIVYGVDVLERVIGMTTQGSNTTLSVPRAGFLDVEDLHGKVKVVIAEFAPGEVRIKVIVDPPKAVLVTDEGEVINMVAAYCVTFVNEWLEESAPSAPQLIEFHYLNGADFSCTYDGYPDGVPITGMNVYRTYGSSDVYMLVNPDPIPPQINSQGRKEFYFQDLSSEPQTTTSLQSAGWDPPPKDLLALTYASNGFFCAYRGRDVHFSEPYRPYAWPYSMTFPDEVRSLIPVESGVLVTTRGQPYIIYGARPEEAMQQVINADQAGVSLNSVARVSGTAAYASHDGIIAVAGGAARMDASRGLFTREVWRKMFAPFLTGGDAELLLAEHDGRLVALTQGDTPNVYGGNMQGFLLDMEEPSGLSWLRLPMDLLGVSVVRETDALYFGLRLEDGTGGYAEAFVGEYLVLAWHSKDYVFPRPVSFGAAVALVDGEFEIRILADGVIVHMESVTSGETSFRLPAVPAQKRWSVKFEGRGIVTKFEMGSTFQELQNA